MEMKENTLELLLTKLYDIQESEFSYERSECVVTIKRVAEAEAKLNKLFIFNGSLSSKTSVTLLSVLLA